MKPEKYREMTRQELEGIARELREELFNLKFRVSTQKLDNPLKLREIRRDLARVFTILREDEIGKFELPRGVGETRQTGRIGTRPKEAKDERK